MKHPLLALTFSFLWSGLGQMYNGQWGRGLLFVLIQIVNFALIYWFVGLITAPIFWLYALLDAVDGAQKINERIEREAALAPPEDE